MDPGELASSADPAVLGAYLASLPTMPHSHSGPSESLRQEIYEGRRIVIRTTYEITVDERPLHIPVSVSNDGTVDCHSLPTYSSPSAIDLVKHLIDYFPDSFPRESSPGHHEGGHTGHADPHSSPDSPHTGHGNQHTSQGEEV